MDNAVRVCAATLFTRVCCAAACFPPTFPLLGALLLFAADSSLLCKSLKWDSRTCSWGNGAYRHVLLDRSDWVNAMIGLLTSVRLLTISESDCHSSWFVDILEARIVAASHAQWHGFVLEGQVFCAAAIRHNAHSRMLALGRMLQLRGYWC